MIKISFIATQRKIISFKIDEKIVTYYDEVWKSGIQVLPKNDRHILKMKRSGKKNIQFMVALIFDANKGEQFEEYKKCKTDEEVAEVVTKDCKSKGLIPVVKKK